MIKNPCVTSCEQELISQFLVNYSLCRQFYLGGIILIACEGKPGEENSLF